jgi:hypothetical protein
MVYIDDMAIAAATKKQIEAVAIVLKRLGDVETFLGLRVVRNRDCHTITISQWPYIERILAKKGWTNLKGAGSPMDPRVKYDPDLPLLAEDERVEYLELVGSAQWISNNMRPDLAYPANFLGRHRMNPTRQYMEQLKRLWRYLSRTKKFGLVLGGTQSLTDVDLWLH